MRSLAAEPLVVPKDALRIQAKQGMMMARSFFWDKIANRYSKQPVADEAAYQKNCRSHVNTFNRISRYWNLA